MSETRLAFFRTRDDGLDLFVRLTPKGGTDRIEDAETAGGMAHLRARVRAAPEKGAANKALEKLVVDWLGVPKSTATVIAGTTSRLKTVRINGDPVDLLQKLTRLADRSP